MTKLRRTHPPLLGDSPGCRQHTAGPDKPMAISESEMECSDEMIFAVRAVDELLAPMISKGDLLMTKRVDRFDEAGLYVLRDRRMVRSYAWSTEFRRLRVAALICHG